LDAIAHVSSQIASVLGSQACIIVCGLHRSGTSAVARLVNLLGADVADDLLPKSSDNSRGYWESRAVVNIHDRLLKTVEPIHDGPFDPMSLPPGWLTSGAAREAKRQLAAVIQREFSDSRLFVVKDPRIARLLPLWIELTQDLGITPTVIIPFRNPLEVAASLAQRDHVCLPKALLLYFHAYLETELASRGFPRMFVRYDHLLKDWRPFVQRLGVISGAQLAAPTQGIAMEINEFLTTDLYHHRFSREQMRQHPEVFPGVVEVFERMDEAAKTGEEDLLRSAFDRLRADAEAAAKLYRGYLATELQDSRQRFVRMRDSYELSTSWRITAPLRWIKLWMSSRAPFGSN
jgi:hypothetical protein